MAALSESARFDCWKEAMKRDLGIVTVTKQDLRNAIDALDEFMDTNAGALNAAIPQPARGGLSPKQKARLLVLVIEKRYEVS